MLSEGSGDREWYHAPTMTERSPSFLADLVFELFPSTGKIDVIDCGAGGGSLRDWRGVARYFRLYGFDPDPEECERLNERARDRGIDETYYPHCLAERDQQGRTFYRTRHRGSCSLFPPDEARIARWRSSFPGPTPTLDLLGVEAVDKVDTVALDSWGARENVRDVDFVKLDVQGAEIEVLRGGEHLLRDALGMLVEVWFTPVYAGIPLFADVDALLRSRGYTLFSKIVDTPGQFVGRVRSPVSFDRVGSPAEQRTAGQLITADVLYLRDPVGDLDTRLSFEKGLKLVCIAEVTGQIEYAFEILYWLKERERASGERSRSGRLAELIERAGVDYANRPRRSSTRGGPLRSTIRSLGRRLRRPRRP